MGRQVTIYALILLLGICSGSLLTAQQIYSPKAAAELALELQDTGSANGQSVISAAKDRTSLVDKIEFRTETDRWDTERQEYLVRTSFKSQKEKNATVGIYDS